MATTTTTTLEQFYFRIITVVGLTLLTATAASPALVFNKIKIQGIRNENGDLKY